MNVRLFLVAVGALLSMPASAANFPATALLSIGFAEVELADLKMAATYGQRSAEASGYLQVSADLNGDGALDEVRILQNHQRQIAYVVAAISSSDKLDTYVLAAFPIAEVPYLAIDLATADEAPAGERKGAGVAVFDLRTGLGEAQFFDGEEFGITNPINRASVVR